MVLVSAAFLFAFRKGGAIQKQAHFPEQAPGAPAPPLRRQVHPLRGLHILFLDHFAFVQKHPQVRVVLRNWISYRPLAFVVRSWFLLRLFAKFIDRLPKRR